MSSGGLFRALRSRLLLAALLPLISSCRGERAVERPRLVVLYAPCTVNASFLSPYDARVEFTPSLARFARDAVVFLRHHTEAGQSGIAYASILSGLQADGHGVYRHPVTLREELVLIGEAYAAAGFETFAWSDHPAASPKLGYTQGIPPGNTVGRKLLAEDPRFVAILERVASDPSYRAFVFTNFTITHTPYRQQNLESFLSKYGTEGDTFGPAEKRYARIHRENYLALTGNHSATIERLGLSPPEVRALIRVIEQMYASQVNRLDRLFGGVINAVERHGVAPDSLVAFTADHGELLYRENAPFPWSHAMHVASEAIRVPLIIRSPGIAPGRYEGVTRSIDLMPTLLALSKIPLPADAQKLAGVDLSGAMSGRETPPELIAFSHSSVLVRSVLLEMYSEKRARAWLVLRDAFPSEDPDLMWATLRKKDLLYRLRGWGGKDWRFEAFDLSKDPAEESDLFDPEDPEHAAMADRLDAYRRGIVRSYREAYGAAGEALLPDREEAEALRSIGYIK